MAEMRVVEKIVIGPTDMQNKTTFNLPQGRVTQKTLPAAVAGVLSLRTSATVGQVTLLDSLSYTNGERVDIFSDEGIASSYVVTNWTGGILSLSAWDARSGDLPTLNAVVQVCKQTEIARDIPTASLQQLVLVLAGGGASFTFVPDFEFEGVEYDPDFHFYPLQNKITFWNPPTIGDGSTVEITDSVLEMIAKGAGFKYIRVSHPNLQTWDMSLLANMDASIAATAPEEPEVPAAPTFNATPGDALHVTVELTAMEGTPTAWELQWYNGSEWISAPLGAANDNAIIPAGSWDMRARYTNEIGVSDWSATQSPVVVNPLGAFITTGDIYPTAIPGETTSCWTHEDPEYTLALTAPFINTAVTDDLGVTHELRYGYYTDAGATWNNKGTITSSEEAVELSGIDQYGVLIDFTMRLWSIATSSYLTTQDGGNLGLYVPYEAAADDLAATVRHDGLNTLLFKATWTPATALGPYDYFEVRDVEETAAYHGINPASGPIFIVDLATGLSGLPFPELGAVVMHYTSDGANIASAVRRDIITTSVLLEAPAPVSGAEYYPTAYPGAMNSVWQWIDIDSEYELTLETPAELTLEGDYVPHYGYWNADYTTWTLVDANPTTTTPYIAVFASVIPHNELLHFGFRLYNNFTPAYEGTGIGSWASKFVDVLVPLDVPNIVSVGATTDEATEAVVDVVLDDASINTGIADYTMVVYYDIGGGLVYGGIDTLSAPLDGTTPHNIVIADAIPNGTFADIRVRSIDGTTNSSRELLPISTNFVIV